jgi:hypothetical protein
VDIPVKARADDVDARKYGYGITWRQSEWRQVSFDHRIYDFSKGDTSKDNLRNEFMLSYQQGLYARHDWLIRSITDAYFSTNNHGGETYYYNPDNDFSLAETLMIQQTVKRLPEEAFIHRVFVTLGFYQQSSEGIDPLFSMKYEQEHQFSPVHSLIWGAGCSSRAYDGDSVWSATGYLTWQYRF